MSKLIQCMGFAVLLATPWTVSGQAPASESTMQLRCGSAAEIELPLLLADQTSMWEGDLTPSGRYRFRLYATAHGHWTLVRAPRPFPEAGEWHEKAVCIVAQGQSHAVSEDAKYAIREDEAIQDRLVDIEARRLAYFLRLERRESASSED